MSARTVTVVTCSRRECDATYTKDTAWAAYEAWAAGWSRRFRRRDGRPTYWYDLCPKHAADDEESAD